MLYLCEFFLFCVRIRWLIKFYLKNSKFNKPDEVLYVWLEIPDYYGGYCGKSLNLKKFWEAVEIKNMTYEEAAFDTFTGKWAKRNAIVKKL